MESQTPYKRKFWRLSQTRLDINHANLVTMKTMQIPVEKSLTNEAVSLTLAIRLWFNHILIARSHHHGLYIT